MDYRLAVRVGLGSVLVLPVLAAGTGCTDDGFGDVDGGEVASNVPVREDFQTVVDGAVFPAAAGCAGKDLQCRSATTQDACNAAPADFACAWFAEGFTTLTVGGAITDDNFANRGDVEVYYVNDDDTISVQMRRFTFGEEGETADMSKMQFWAYDLAPTPPNPDLDNRRCGEVWRDGCEIRAYYDGLVQPLRDGADFRVYLPRGWTGTLVVETEDNDFEPERYPDRSDVVVKGAAGSVDVTLGAGLAHVEMAEDLRAAPGCSAEQEQACLDVGWDLGDPSCSCTDFGSLKIEAAPGRAMSAIVDVPDGLWANACLENEQPGIHPLSDPLCTAEIRCDQFTSCDVDQADADKPWKTCGELNDPGDEAIEGAGFLIRASSGACADMAFVTGPEDYEAPDAQERGFLELCSDCLDLPVSSLEG